MIADYDGDMSELLKMGVEGNIPVLATRSMVLFPGVVSPVVLGRTPSLNLINAVKNHPNAIFVIVSQKIAET